MPNAKGLKLFPEYVRPIHGVGRGYCSPRMSYTQKNLETRIYQDYGSPEDIFPYSIDEDFIDLTGSLNYFVP